jgi:hypothetical protein
MITVKKLAAAIETRLGLSAAEACEEARTVLSYFGFRDTIIDNAIEPDDRRLFYLLSDAGFLQSYWETVPLLNGRNWRIFYWTLDVGAIERLQKDDSEPPQEHIYQTLPEEAWSHTPSAS